MDIITHDEFLDLRAEWKAAGCPNDHRYLTGTLESEANPSRPTSLALGISDAELEAHIEVARSIPEQVVGIGADGRTRWVHR